MARPLSPLTKFILSLPRDTKVADVIAQAKAKGMKTSKSNVHQVRSKYGNRAGASKAPSAGKSASPAKGAPAKRAAAPARPAASSGGGSNESSFRRMVLDLGVRRSRELLSDVERKLAAIVGG